MATTGETVGVNGLANEESLSPSNHEEADTRMLLHIRDATDADHREITIRTVDTDVVVLAVSFFQRLNLEKMWIEIGTGKNKRWIPVHEYALKLPNNMCMALPFWYAFTGCDTVSAFCGRGKRFAGKFGNHIKK